MDNDRPPSVPPKAEPSGRSSDPSDGPRLVRELLASEHHAFLSTLSARLGGYPFGSSAPYALMPDGRPILWLSDLAEHTRNLRADPRACLYVGHSEDPGASRISLVGRAATATGDDVAVAESRYLARFPAGADRRASLGGFSYWVFDVEHVRWIAGFGLMGWLAWGADVHC